MSTKSRGEKELHTKHGGLSYNPDEDLTQLSALLVEIIESQPESDEDWRRILRRYPKPNGGFYGKPALISAARRLVEQGKLDARLCHQVLTRHLRLKPSRTQSGVSTVTVLTKPYPCPGQCIFCPNDVRMPKSYLSDEPGAQRAANNQFDPYAQTWNRLLALHNIGHPVEKIEIIILGGTWSSYSSGYQRYFIERVFAACNDFGENLEVVLALGGRISPFEPKRAHPLLAASEPDDEVERSLDQGKMETSNTSRADSYNLLVSRALRRANSGRLEMEDEEATWEELELRHYYNVRSRCRVVGLTIETRPDEVTVDEVERLRRLGATKIQMGVQSLNDQVLQLNQRGHSVAEAELASVRLRSAGFKLHYHWMANLLGSDLVEDERDYRRLFSNLKMCPDELKLYPCSLIPNTPLMTYYDEGKWHPYSREELLELLVAVMPITPDYCRLTRVIRDIPSTDIHVGNQETNFREVAEAELARRGVKLREIRAREVRGRAVSSTPPDLIIFQYQTEISDEFFITYEDNVTESLLGFCRLSLHRSENGALKTTPYLSERISHELSGGAIIRELHVYGQSLILSDTESTAAQHKGLGRSLVEEAKRITQEAGYKSLAVISAIGTQEYYEKIGFSRGDLYHHIQLT